MATNFRVNNTSPSNSAEPDINKPPVVQWPQAQAKYGTGIPAKAIGLPFCEVGRDLITQTGLTYWTASFTGGASQLYISVSATLYDPLENKWRDTNGSCRMWRPSFEPVVTSACVFRNFRVRFEGIEFT